MKKLMKMVCGGICGIFLMASVVFAAENGTVAGSYTGEDYVSLYVRGGSEAAGEAQVGTAKADVTKVQKLSESDIPVKTLILVDNSISIQEAQRTRIAEVLQDVVASLMKNETVALATYSEEINYLTDYTDDYVALKQAIEGIQYQDQETYLTDVLYNLLTGEFASENAETFHRIVVISDGVDNKAIGITTEELYSYLQKSSVPVYTIGCREKKNDEQLKNMFAISRISGADSFMLDDVENTLDIVNVLAKDKEILRVQVKPDKTSMDGSQKAVKLTMGEETFQAELTMPQQEIEETKPAPTTKAVQETVIVEVPVEPEKKPVPVALIAGGAVVAVIVVIAVVVVIIRKRKSKNSSFETYTEGSFASPDDDSHTFLLGDSQKMYELLLEDTTNPAISFRVSLSETSPVIIGRKREACNVCIDSERSVSGRHCEIGVRNDHFYIRDLQSSNGTYLNDKRVVTEAELISGNIIRLGVLQFRVNIH